MPVSDVSVRVCQKEQSGGAVTILGRVGEHMVPERLRTDLSAGCLQPPAVVDLGKKRRGSFDVDDGHATIVGHLGAESCEAAIEGDAFAEGGRAVSEAVVDAGLAGRQGRKWCSGRLDVGVKCSEHRA
ncbi:hypothetical protein SPFL3102_03922 [Sporomusaceae bacterium FL31]|nr:hypothetical protein SPFL3102_03922 [Sporomusaceae bacterium]